MDGVEMENPSIYEWIIWQYPHFRKAPCICHGHVMYIHASDELVRNESEASKTQKSFNPTMPKKGRNQSHAQQT